MDSILIPIAVEASIQFLTARGAELGQSQLVTGANRGSYVGPGMLNGDNSGIFSRTALTMWLGAELLSVAL